jgi:hypothetical protein
MPIYLVKNKQNPEAPDRLVEADNNTQGLRFVANDTFSIKVANATEVGNLMSSGVELERATSPQRELLGDEQ